MIDGQMGVMMKAGLTILMLAAPVALHAQAAPIGQTESLNGLDYSAYRTAVDSYTAGMNYSPEMSLAVRRQQLRQAIALREEANELRIADGGTLSPNHLRYVQRKADAIRKGR